MKQISKLVIIVPLVWCILGAGCRNRGTSMQNQNSNEFSESQKELLEKGWFIPGTVPAGELSSKYGVESKFGQQDNYFDIETGPGCDVAIKIVNKADEQCIRYVFVPEDTTINIQMIPQGQYYLKLAYGKEWMEYINEDGTIDGKFTSNVFYDKSVDVFDFGKKNSSSVINYVLRINVKENNIQNNFETVSISESEFRR